MRSFGRSDPARDGEVSGGSLSWSPRGDRIAFVKGGWIRSEASGTSNYRTLRGDLTVWDLDGKQLLHVEEEGVGVSYGCSLGADGGRVAAVRVRSSNFSGLDARETEVKVWDVATGRVITTIPDCSQAVLDPPGKRLAGFATSRDGSRRTCLWNAETGLEITRLEEPDPELEPFADSLAFSPDGQRVAASIFLRSPGGPMSQLSKPRMCLAVWDLATGKLIQRLPDRSGTLVFSPDGSRIACVYGSATMPAAASAEVGLWDAATGRQLLALKGHGPSTLSSYSGIAFSEDGRKIISAVGQSRILSGPGLQIEIRTWDATPWIGSLDGGHADHR